MVAPLREAHQRGEYRLGERFKVHTIDRGTRASMQRQAGNLRSNLLKHLDHHYQLGLFSVSARESDDGSYEIFVEYHGEAPSAQMKGKWKAQRRRKNQGSRTAEG